MRRSAALVMVLSETVQCDSSDNPLQKVVGPEVRVDEGTASSIDLVRAFMA
jgi:hypothetical protein